jgi:hypothetical protein
LKNKKLIREYKMLGEMISLTCRHQHAPPDNELCPACAELLDYARTRLEKCPYLEDKPACRRCPIHCYKKNMRERIRDVMRYAGPRMILHHPLMAMRHLLNG